MRTPFVALALLAACQTAADAPTPSIEGWVRHVPSIGWRDLPGYSVTIPQGVKRRHAQGIDSEVALFEGAGLTISFDYGMYTALPGCEPRSRCRKEKLTIDGREAQAVSIEGGGYPEAPYRMAFHVVVPVRLQTFEVGKTFEPAVNLGMHAQCLDAAACQVARTIASTIKFGKYAQVTPQPPPPNPPRQEPPPPPPQPEPERPCRRVDEREARSFQGLELMGTIGTARVYGRRGQMLCSEPGAGGRGECEIVGRSEIRIEFPTGASGFRTNGAEPVIFEYGPSSFSCRARSSPY